MIARSAGPVHKLNIQAGESGKGASRVCANCDVGGQRYNANEVRLQGVDLSLKGGHTGGEGVDLRLKIGRHGLLTRVCNDGKHDGCKDERDEERA